MADPTLQQFSGAVPDPLMGRTPPQYTQGGVQLIPNGDGTFRAGQPVAPPNTSAPVPSSQLTGGSLNLPASTPPDTGANLVSGALGSQVPTGQSQTPATDAALTGDYTQDPTYQAANSQLQGSESQLQTAEGQMPNESDLLKSAQDTSGATADMAKLKQLNTELASATAEFDNASASAETRGIQAGTPAVFYQGEQAAIQRQKAVVVGAKASQVAAAQGNYNLSESLAEKTAALKFSDWQNKINNIKDFIQLNQDNLSRAEKVAVSKMQVSAAEQQATLDAQKTNMQLALSTGVKTPFVNKNGEFFNTANGKVYSTPEAFFAAAGVKDFNEAYTKGIVSDINGQSLDNMDIVKQARAKYPDVNIPLTATPDQVAQIIKGSAIHRKETYIAPPAGGGGPGVYISGADPIADSWVASVKNGNATMAQVPAQYKNQVALGLNQGSTVVDPNTDAKVQAIIAAHPGEYGKAADAIDAQFGKGTATKYDAQLKGVYNNKQNVDQAFSAASYSPLAASRFATASNRIVSNYEKLPAYQLAAGGVPYVSRILAASTNSGSVSDQELLDAFTKLSTSGNAITDAQIKTVTGGQSFADAVNTFQNKFKNGGVLSDNQRKQIIDIAQKTLTAYQKDYQPVYTQVTKQLTDAGIPKAFWTLPDLNAIAGQGSQSQPQTYVVNGETYHLGPDGLYYK